MTMIFSYKKDKLETVELALALIRKEPIVFRLSRLENPDETLPIKEEES